VRHHTECWDDGGACAACGREQRLELAAKKEAARPAAAEEASVVYVGGSRPGAPATIAEALRTVAVGGKVIVAPGHYRESLVLDRPVTLAGLGEGAVILEASDSDALRVEAERATIEGLTVRVRAGCLGDGSSALHITRGAVRVADCELATELLAPCVSVEGRDAWPRLERCRIRGGQGGGVVVAGGARGTFEKCIVAGHRTFGFSLRSEAAPEVVACEVSGGTIGAVVSEGARGAFRSCEFTLSREAGVRVTSGSRPTFERCRVRDVKGEGVRVDDHGEGTFDDLQVLRSGGVGVLVEQGGDPLIRASRVLGGSSTGVAFRANARGRLDDSRVSENAGAGIEIAAGAVPHVAACRIRGNEGPAVRVRPQASGIVERCELRGNRGGPWHVEGGTVQRRENLE
jgi:hypothetical protein